MFTPVWSVSGAGLAREVKVMAYRDRELTFEDLRGLRAEG